MLVSRRLSSFQRALVVATTLALALLMNVGGASAARDPLAEAEARVTNARQAAIAASQDYADAQNNYYELESEAASTRESISSIERKVAELEDITHQRALVAYTGSSLAIEDLVAGDDVMQMLRRNELLDRANERSNEALDQLGGLNEELKIRSGQLSKQLDDQRSELDEMQATNERLQAALADATEAERELKDRLAREQRAREYAERVAAARARAAEAAQSASSDSGSSGSDSGSSSGGGGGGQVIGSGSWVCPVQGPVAFGNDWGDARSGGRSHQGNDMMSPTGTPVVAVVAGSISHSQGNLQGNGLWLYGNDGNSYFYAHLNDYVGSSRSVSAGEVIGHVGNTGNASGGPAHLHFEIHPGGGAATNPYPTLSAHC